MLIAQPRRKKRTPKKNPRRGWTQGSRSPGKRFSQRPLSYMIEAIVCFSVIGVFLYGFYCYAQTADYFCVKTIGVEGGDSLRDDVIIDQSGITNTDNLLFLDTEAVSEKVKALSFVETCNVSRIFPDKAMIRIEKRVPVATLQINNRLFEIDSNGNVLRKLNLGESHVGPFISNIPDVGYIEIGQRVTDRVLQEALKVWRAFSETSMASDVTVSEISAEQENRIVMYCDELDFEIRWGRGDVDKQAWKLDILWQAQGGQLACKEYVDLRFGNDVACR